MKIIPVKSSWLQAEKIQLRELPENAKFFVLERYFSGGPLTLLKTEKINEFSQSDGHESNFWAPNRS